jgi:periplasmic protein CpxP/Spy
MKKLIVIAIALISIQGIAQQEKKQRPNNQERSQRMNDLTPEEMANLQTKKMTLHLDLNEKQQKDIYKLNLENATKRKEMMATFKAKKQSGQMEKPSKEQRLAMANAKLDHQIAMKAKMKSILNADQLAKWEKAQAKMADRKKGMRKGDGKKQGERAPKQG